MNVCVCLGGGRRPFPADQNRRFTLFQNRTTHSLALSRQPYVPLLPKLNKGEVGAGTRACLVHDAFSLWPSRSTYGTGPYGTSRTRS